MNCSQLLTLFDSILVPILSEWICDEDLCYLDSAVCNLILRKCFLAVLSRVSIINVTFNEVSEMDVYEWIARRELGLKKVVLYDDAEPQRFSLVLALITKTVNLSDLSINLLEVSVKAFLDIGIRMRVRNLQVLNCDDESLLLFLEMLNNSVVHLDLSDVSPSIDVYSKIAALCPDLASIELPVEGALAIASLLVNCEIKFQTCDFIQPYMEEVVNYSFELSSTCSSRGISLPIGERFYHLTKICIDEADESAPELTEALLELTIPHVHNLQHLVLGGDLHQILLRSVVTKCFALRRFVADGVSFESKDLITICKNCRLHLRALKVSFCIGIDETDILEATQHCPYLTELRVHRTSISESACVLLQKQCPLLSILYLLYCFFGDVMNIANNLGSVTFYAGIDCLQIHSERRSKHLATSASIYYHRRFFQQNPDLMKIEFQGVELNEEVLCNIAHCCPSLRKFTYWHRKEWDNPKIVHLARCRRLISLELSGLTCITDFEIASLLQDKPNFLSLDLQECTGFTSRVCSIVGKYCLHIQYLDVSGASGIMPAAVIKLIASCPKLHGLRLKEGSPDDASMIVSSLSRKLRLLKFGYLDVYELAKQFLSTDTS